ncbi:MAG: STAS/SEC14 domain-containing protein [Saprospiraceae bacterium]|nr:STAS/SEC14 domain-containing protein [Saprospiraceae bacterium]
MTTIPVQPGARAAMNEILHGVSELDTPDLENFFHQVAHLLAKRKAPSLAKREAELLLKISEGYPVELRKKYDALASKMQDKTISPDEHREILNLTDRMEALDAKRLELLLELAQLRNISLDQLLSQLGLPPHAHG